MNRSYMSQLNLTIRENLMSRVYKLTLLESSDGKGFCKLG